MCAGGRLSELLQCSRGFDRKWRTIRNGKGKGKIYPRTDHEGPEGSRGIAILFLPLTSTLDGVGGQGHAPADLPPVKRPGTQCIGGWVGPRAGLDGCGISRPTGIRSLNRPACSE